MYREEFDVEIRTEVYEESVEPTANGGVRVHLDDGTTAEGDQLFLFTGRRQSFPAGIGETELLPGPGWVDATMQSNDDDRVFVVGDAIGERMLLHTAKEEGSSRAGTSCAPSAARHSNATTPSSTRSSSRASASTPTPRSG